MNGVTISIDDEDATAAISRLVNAAEHPGEATSAMAAYLLMATQRRFELEQGPDGKPWRRLADSTSKSRVGRRGRRGTANILRVTTRLYRSLSSRSDELTAEVGTNLVYAAPHQFGAAIQQYARSQRATFLKVRGTNRRRFGRTGARGGVERNITIGEHTINIPARPYFGFSDADIVALYDIGVDHIRRKVEQ